MTEPTHPYRLGLTGGIGCGKTTAGQMLTALGWTVIDTDELAREILGKDQQIITAITKRWPSCKSPSGIINRARLAEIVFNDPEQLKTLNSIVHPKVRESWRCLRNQAEHRGQKTVVIIPLLHEVGAAEEFDSTICVGCSTTTQLTRLAQRGWSEEHTKLRLKSQLPLEQKIALSDYVVWNDDHHEIMLAQLRGLANSYYRTDVERQKGS